ncbi:MAG: thioredoxin-like domain-containing protein, partial [Bacteroidota bacterium]
MRQVLLCLSLFLFLACGGSNATSQSTDAGPVDRGPSESPNIRVDVTGFAPEGALLIGQVAEQQYRAAEATTDGNAAVFQREEPFPAGHYYVYYPNGQGVQVLITEDQTFSITAESANPVETMQATGSEENRLLYEALRYELNQQPEFSRIAQALRAATNGSDEYARLQEERRQLVGTRGAFQEELFAQAPNSLFTAYKRAGRNPQLREIRLPTGAMDEQAQVTAFRYDFWDGVNFNDERLLRTPVIFNKLKRFVTELTPQNADSIKAAADFLLTKVLDKPEYFKFIANWITLQYEPGKSTVMDAEAIHVHMIQNYFTRERAFWSDSMTVWGLQDRASQMANSLVGQAGPNVVVPGLDGKPKPLYDLKKPYVAVFMYNPECEHCIEQTPKLTQAYSKLRDQLDVYAIALDTDKEKWQNFVRQYGLTPFTNVFDPTNRTIFKTYYVDNTPELYLLNPDRKIVAKNLKVEQLAEAIRLDQSR